MSISASDALTESLLVLESEFNELEQEYRGDLQEQSILEDPESPGESLSALSEVDSEPDGPSSSLCQCVETEASGSELLEESKVQKFLPEIPLKF